MFVFKNLHQLFDKLAVACTERDALSKVRQHFFKFCGLLRKPKLYLNDFTRYFIF